MPASTDSDGCGSVEWRVEAVRALQELSSRRGVVTLDDVESMLPDVAGEQDVREVVEELAARSVHVAEPDGDSYGSGGGASVLSRYYRDMGRRPLLTAEGERVLGSRLQRGVLRSNRALARTVACARAAVAAVREVVARRRPLVDVVTDETAKRGRAALGAAVERAEAAIDACVEAERAAMPRWRHRAVRDRLVAGRERVRMGRAVLALGLSPAGFEELEVQLGASIHQAQVLDEQRAYREALAAARVSDGDGKVQVVCRKSSRGADGLAFLLATKARFVSGRRLSNWARDRLIESERPARGRLRQARASLGATRSTPLLAAGSTRFGRRP